MLLPEKGCDVAVCDPHTWEAPRDRQGFWRAAVRRLRFSGPRLATDAKPATRLAKLMVSLRTSANAQLTSDDPDLLPRLERHLSITGDGEVRTLFSVYLSEP
jgi:hypothetical protein